jgi:hypothetical protein
MSTFIAWRDNGFAELRVGDLTGNQGELIEDWLNDLKQPGTQAIIIAAAAVKIAGGCFYFARLLDDEDKPADETR